MTTATAKFTVLGITDDRTDCECCGKPNLKCTVAMEKEDGQTVYYGRHCAAMAMLGSKSARNVSKIEVAAAQAMRDAEYNRQAKLSRIAGEQQITVKIDGKSHTLGYDCPKSKANYLYNRTQRPLANSYFAIKADLIVRVDGNDAADVAFYQSEGFVKEVA